MSRSLAGWVPGPGLGTHEWRAGSGELAAGGRGWWWGRAQQAAQPGWWDPSVKDKKQAPCQVPERFKFSVGSAI